MIVWLQLYFSRPAQELNPNADTNRGSDQIHWFDEHSFIVV